MITSVESVTNQMLELALDAASLNQQAIANNIANVNTPNYVPLRTDFEEQMASVRRTLDHGGRVSAGMLNRIHPELVREQSSINDDRTASLDMETARMAENLVQYEALLKVAGLRMSLLKSAISEGKG